MNTEEMNNVPENIKEKAYNEFPITAGENGEADIMKEKRDGYIQGLMELEKMPRIKVWAARDKNGTLWSFAHKPQRIINGFAGSDIGRMDKKLFPDLKWEDEPIQFEMLIKEEKI